jgi:protein ImuA
LEDHTGTCAPWTLGASQIDSRLGPDGLALKGLHEVKPVAGGSEAQSAAIAFALRLAARRQAGVSFQGRPKSPILWCMTGGALRETGRLHGPGLAALGLDPSAVLIVETARAQDALWALEEGLRSGALALAIGIIPVIALTPSRRLALAAEEHLTPALLVTEAGQPAMAATATRWRAGPAGSAPHPFDLHAPGAARLALTLERSRGRPGTETSPCVVEWSHETHRFRMAADVADRALAPVRGAGGRLRSGASR